MKTVSYFKKYSLYTLLAAGVLFTSCDEDVPEAENEVEVITDVTLIFTNEDDATDIVEAHAEDTDGEGIEELIVEDEINLDADKTYILTFDIENALAEEDEDEHEDDEHDEHDDDDDDDEHSHGADITADIEKEDDEHQLFFSFSSDAFASPTGDGNIDANATGSEAINYNDADDNGNPVGLSTSWTTSSDALSDGEFTVRLQHQPDVKSATSGADDGETDFELEFVLNIN